MLELISSLSPFAFNLLVVSIFSFLWACLIYIVVRGISSLVSTRIKIVYYWRSFWICTLCVISLPFFLSQLLDISPTGLVPEVSYEVAPLDVNLGHRLGASPLLEDGARKLSDIDILASGWLIFYISGTLLSLSLMFRRHYRLLRGLEITAKTVIKKKVIGSLLTSAQYEYLSKNNVRVIVTEAKCSPFVFGLFKLNLVLPSYLLSMDAGQKQLVMEHELTHIRRHDPMLIMAAHILGCFLWFIPFLKWFKEQLSWAIELSCDREVLRTAGMGLGKVYAQAMLRTLQECSGPDNRNGVVAFSMFDKTSQLSLIKKRMLNIRDAAQESASSNKFKMGVLRVSLIFFTVFFTVVGAMAKPSLSIVNPEVENWIVPIQNARISSLFGDLNKVRNNSHRGTDFAAPLGTAIVAPAGGVVIVSTDHYRHKNYGKIIIIDHGQNIQTLYSHLDTREVKVGQSIKMGQKIGTVGITGKVTGPHLHFELIKQGERVNPEYLLKLWFG
ncbi:peptidoglycan DD-metalloendopeptidase family protein [Microbulbifer sp. VTAC004]|uniref:peptidoglycan DD-metalloendopeptidase family protein n=1 Tax=Microbulbifer sp. VTAC004 TaxID=3243386 RepID=UPI0040391CC3